MKRLLILIPLLAALFGAQTSHAQVRVGVMNPQEVLAAMPEVRSIEENLQQYVTEKETEFQTRYTEWLERVTRYQENLEGNLLTQEAQAREETELTEIQAELEAMNQRFQIDLQNRRSQLLEPLLARMDQAMAEVAEENGIGIVINKATAAGDPIVYFASARATDLTPLVIQRLSNP